MGIYINGIEMPKGDNWKTIRIYPNGACAVPNWQGDCTFIRGAQAVPFAEKRGKWIDGAADFTNGNKTHECSYCGGYIDMYKGGADDYYFCPYCGARMKDEK